MISSQNALAVERAKKIAPYLNEITASQLAHLVGSGALIDHIALGRGSTANLGAFYAPFDWVNGEADIILVGVTPGKRQAEHALVSLQKGLAAGIDTQEALRTAKEEASFVGAMRKNATVLMDYFRINELLGLRSTGELFNQQIHRVHFTSAYRYPVLEKGARGWKDYSGNTSEAKLALPLLSAMVEEFLIPELQSLPNAWLVPFGPTPAKILENLARRSVIDSKKILAGLNHPAGTQWNRHNCQMNLVDHADCARNVGCDKIQARSRQLLASVGRQLRG